MGQQVNVYRTLKIWPGARVEGWLPSIMGDTYYVDTYGSATDDSNAGTDPNYPMTTVNAAMGRCTTDHNDYVIILDAWTSDTEPITVNKTRVHFVGINPSPAPMYVVMTPGTDESVFKMGSASNHCEIAGINLGGGANHGGIELNSGATAAYGLWIHDCVFGHEFPGGATPKYGIFNVQPAGPTHCVIEDNHFYGTTSVAWGKIDDSGMLLYGAKGTIIRRNTFLGLPAFGISLSTTSGAIIQDNRISLDTDQTGGAITLAACTGCWVDGNPSHFGDTDAMGKSPFADDSSDGNNWGSNWVGNAVDFPA